MTRDLRLNVAARGSELVSHAPIPENLTDEEVLAALDRIPTDFRAVVLLVDVEEFTYKEATEILSVPIGTAMSRLSRGRKLFKFPEGSPAQGYAQLARRFVGNRDIERSRF